MLGARLIAIGAGIALAVHGVVAADQATTTRLHITLRAGTVHADEHVQIKQYEDPNPTVSYGNGGSSDDATGSDDGSNDSGDYGTEGSGESNSCDYGWSEVTVEGAYGVFCVEDTPCGDAFGACPGPQAGLEQGSYCAQDGYGSYVCKEGFRPVDYSWSDDLNPAGGGEYPPGSQSGAGDDPNPVYKTCGEWQSPMSVEGVEGVFCVYGLPCVRAIMGSCPEPQDGLPYGAYCGTVSSGVFGCKPVTEDMFHNQEIPTDDSGSGGVTTYEHQCEDGLTPMSVEHIPGVFCIEGPVCVADTLGSCPGPQYGLEFGAYCGEVETGVLGCKAYSAWPTDTGSGSNEYPDYGDDSGSGPTMTIEPPPVYTNVCSAPDETPMSVEGVEGTFCVSGQACAGVDGTCPGPQAGLELGSHCGIVASGVLGCLPGPAFCSGPGDSQMSVEGVNGVFCVNGQACAGVDGACPGPQPGLELGSYCGIVASGVKGCVPNVAPALRAHKKHKQTSRKH